jgi:outer membrane protein OmpA-like peptidoglycan-associated protein
MRSDLSEVADIAHRRGAVMGLTVAESFIVITFVLLMLLALWRAETEADAAFLETMSVSQRSAVTKLSNAGRIDAMAELAEAGFDAAAALDAMKGAPDGVVVVPAAMLDELRDAARLVDEADIAEMARLAADLPQDQRRALERLVQLDDYRAALEKIAAQDAAIRSRDGERTLRDRVSEQLAEAAAAQAGLVDALRGRLGDVVADIGGAIGVDGAITLPDTLVFDAGEATINADMDRSLGRICEPWIETLKAAQAEIEDIRIEGHASPEFGNLSPRLAFEANLDLSQRRASAVLLRCLDLIGDADLRDWALPRIAAIGYSSSRLVVVDGAEDWKRSRRVVFRANVSKDDVVDAIEREVGPDLELLAALRDGATTAMRPLDYDAARRAIFSGVNVDPAGMVRGLYSGFAQASRDVTFLDPINVEHIVPQSWFEQVEPMRSDLHALFPVHGRVNNARGAAPFAEIPDNRTTTWWGTDGDGVLIALQDIPRDHPERFAEIASGRFEPPEAVKGDVARAIFYFWMRYGDAAGPIERIVADDLATLGAWSRDDPPDVQERARHERVALAQGNTNPFIEEPGLECRVFSGVCDQSSASSSLRPGAFGEPSPLR